jgi:hypothetical protein
MTVLSTEKIFELPRDKLWRIASQFNQAARWIDRIEKAEHISGNATNVGGVWRVYERWNFSYRVTDFEITEWLEGERFGLRPLLRYAENVIAELYQIVINLKTLSDNQTLVSVQCEYKPRHPLAKIKNLFFLRRQYLRRLEASLEALARVATEPAAGT